MGKETWARNDDALVDVFAIAGDRELTVDVARSWTDQQCQEAEEWAWALHFRASDNPRVKVPPMPAHVRDLPIAQVEWGAAPAATEGE